MGWESGDERCECDGDGNVGVVGSYNFCKTGCSYTHNSSPPPPLPLQHQSHPPPLCTNSPSSPSSPLAPPSTIQTFNTTLNPKPSSTSPALDSACATSLTMLTTRSTGGSSSAFACWVCVTGSRVRRGILSLRCFS